MRKASAELNFSIAIENVGVLCGQKLEELPYWETINRYLERVNPQDLQDIISGQFVRLCAVFPGLCGEKVEIPPSIQGGEHSLCLSEIRIS